MAKQEINHMRIAVTYHCNLKCKHCYVPEVNRTNYNNLENDQLSLSQIKDFIDYLIINFNLKKVTITGGEALLRNVWPRTKAIMEYAFEKGLAIQLNTSCCGQISMSEVAEISKGYLDKLLLHASLDGVIQDKVDEFRGINGSFRKAIKTIKDAVDEGICTQVRYTITASNYDEALICYDFVSQIGVDSYMIKPMYPAGNAKINKELLVRSIDDIKILQLRLIKKSIDNKTRLDLPRPTYFDKKDIPSDANMSIVDCSCGVTEGYLDYNGDIYPCSYLVGATDKERFVIGNIKDQKFDLEKIWVEPSTYYEFKRNGKEICTAHELLNEKLKSEEKINEEGNKNVS